ncbi:E3 ubiquitin-protein ligase hyd [Frankliniella fusca]|uniref:E3 ubiquitin-protein ligase hyd n=1 Tax=Frankliniella fusca TaxID=407009 RepID=A0AAE1LAG2_9NEOP|nr:E3 ubiquitin-protein ligase hyd [Frankliniella fusca]
MLRLAPPKFNLFTRLNSRYSSLPLNIFQERQVLTKAQYSVYLRVRDISTSYEWKN